MSTRFSMPAAWSNAASSNFDRVPWPIVHIVGRSPVSPSSIIREPVPDLAGSDQDINRLVAGEFLGWDFILVDARRDEYCSGFIDRQHADVHDGCIVEVGSGSGELGCQLIGLGARPPTGEIAADEGGSSAAQLETAVQQIQHARLGVPERQN